MTKCGCAGTDSTLRLDAEITEFIAWMEPTESELNARNELLARMMGLIKEHVPNLATEPFGSQTTGLAMPTSDIDIRIYDPKHNAKIKRGSATYLKYVHEIFVGLKRMEKTLRLDSGFVLAVFHQGHFPLVSAQHIDTSLMVQIVAASPPYKTQQSIRTLVAEYPNLKPLFMVIKTIFDMRGLSDVYNGGLGSYSIFNMIVASLRLHARLYPNPESPPTPGTQLLDFLRFYGTQLNTYRWGISTSTGKLFAKRSTLRQRERKQAVEAHDWLRLGQQNIQRPVRYQRFLLCLQDAADPYNDLGKKSFAIKHVQATLNRLYNQMMLNLKPKKLPPDSSLLRPLVGRCDLVYDERRAKLELYGESIMDGANKESGRPSGVGEEGGPDGPNEEPDERVLSSRPSGAGEKSSLVDLFKGIEESLKSRPKGAREESGPNWDTSVGNAVKTNRSAQLHRSRRARAANQAKAKLTGVLR